MTIAQRIQLNGLIGNNSTEQEEETKSGWKVENYDEEENQSNVDTINHAAMTEMDAIDTSIAKPSRTYVKQKDTIIVGTLNSIDELNQQIIENIVKDEEGKHCCKICGRSSSKSSHVKEHVEVHFEGLSFPCTYCSYVGRYRYKLRKHRSVHKKYSPL